MATNTLFDLAYRLVSILGVAKDGVATGGSTTTIVDTVARTEDSDYWNGGTAFIVKDAGGAGAAPEKEYKVITDFDKATATVTAGTFTSAVGAGDLYSVANKWLPLYTITSAINAALLDLGAVPLVDTSTITTAANQTEHSLPAAAGRDLRRVSLQTQSDSNDNRWVEINGWSIQRAAAGSADLLILPAQYTAGYTVKLEYMAVHPMLTASTSALSEAVPAERVVYPAALECLYHLAQATNWDRWDKFIRRMEGKVEQIRQTRPIIAPRRPTNLMIVNSDQNDGDDYDFTVNKVRV